jgi:hypothetical protein
MRMLRVGTIGVLVGVCALTGVSSSAYAADAGVPACAASELSARQTGSGAGMSQPYSIITVTNAGSDSCALKGYPSITGAWTKTGRKAIHITRGSLGNMSDPGPTQVVLSPGGRAWFAVGAATAYDPPLVTFTRLAFSTAPGVAGSVMARLQLQATAPHGKPFPIGVTAFAPGRGPRP